MPYEDHRLFSEFAKTVGQMRCRQLNKSRRNVLDHVYELTGIGGFSFKASTFGYDVCFSAKLASNDRAYEAIDQCGGSIRGAALSLRQ